MALRCRILDRGSSARDIALKAVGGGERHTANLGADAGAAIQHLNRHRGEGITVTLKLFLRVAVGLGIGLFLSLGVTTQASAVEKVVKYQLGAGADSSVIALPANVPVLVIGNQVGDTSDFGVLQMVISNDVIAGVNWSGSSSFEGPKNGFDGATGDVIMSLDAAGNVPLTIDFVLNKKANTGGSFGMVIKNMGTTTVSGQVKLFY